MRNTLLSAAVGLCVVASSACSGGSAHQSSRQRGADANEHAAAHNRQPAHGADAARQPERRQADPHGFGAAPAGIVPAYVTDAAALKSLPPTLPPETFTGRRREGYEAVRAIPETIAQLPCYCHCDRGFGHKSLHSCFVDDHGANCSICLEEALLAYRLEKEEKLKPEQIRERIIAQYGGR
ncbi:MAG TPA: CYCXC family (seleno)protein [Pyrinomonadaceae bacterium]|nr:CYCXC family (seleno)protein [Pyrinomonadaceae bacterium]